MMGNDTVQFTIGGDPVYMKVGGDKVGMVVEILFTPSAIQYHIRWSDAGNSWLYGFELTYDKVVDGCEKEK